MRELYNITVKDAAENAIVAIKEAVGCSRAMATKLFKNTLIYNCVIDEIVGQAMFLAEKEEDLR